jgi:hypothetical protein
MSTYTPIATQTLGSAAASVTFSSIPQGYTDLVLVMSVKGSTANFPTLRFNSDSGSNYSRTILTGNGSAASSERGTSETGAAINFNAQTSTSEFNYNSITHIQNYSNSTTYKTQLTRANQAALGVDAIATLWRNTAPITEITIYTNTGNHAAGSTFTLYGIQVGNAAQKAQGGNIVTSDGTYMYHAFTTSGTFIPSQAISADVLCVAGGGGGGGDMAGGGGAGGLLYQAGKSLTAKSYPVIVGAGGTGNITDGSSTGVLATNGSDSVFGAMTAIGGGAGRNSGTAISGGSGGGSARGGAGGSATQGNSDGATGYGYAGGTSSEQGSGGGGAGAAGGNGGAVTVGAGGAGGVGFRNSVIDAMGSATGTGEVSSSNYYFAGGGGGSARNTAGAAGAGGLGGGGAGTKAAAAATSGTRNTGGGGGGGSENGSVRNGGSGGSGIVIIRYAL